MIRDQLAQVEAHLRGSVFGQDEAVARILVMLRRHWMGMAHPTRPIGRFILAGPSGVGKTWLAESLAAALHGIDSRKQLDYQVAPILRVDCGEFHLEHHASRLMGAPPGYLGHGTTPPLLTTANIERVTSGIRGIAAGVCIFDEIEKAHPSLYNLLLGVLDTGKLTNSNGEIVLLHNLFIFFTSNLGATARKHGYVGDDPKAAMFAAVNKHFSPEFLNRIDHVAVFNTLPQETLQQITDENLEACVERIEKQNFVKVDIGKHLRAEITRRGSSSKYGARPLRRTIEAMVVDPVLDYLVSVESRRGTLSSIKIEFEPNNEVVISSSRGEAKHRLELHVN